MYSPTFLVKSMQPFRLYIPRGPVPPRRRVLYARPYDTVWVLLILDVLLYRAV